MLQFGASLTDDAGSGNYDRNMFIIQATDVAKNLFVRWTISEWQEKGFMIVKRPSLQKSE